MSQETGKTEEIEISKSDFVNVDETVRRFEYPLQIFEDLKCIEIYEDGEFVKREWEGDTNAYSKVVSDMENLYPKGVLTRDDSVASSTLSGCRSIEDVFNESCLKEFPLT